MKLSLSLLSALLLISCVAASRYGSMVQISREEINRSDLIQDIIDHGVDYCFQKAANKYGVSDSNIEVTHINSVYKLESGESTIYQCDVEATNNDGETLKAQFNIQVNLETEDQIVTKWGYNLVFDDSNSQDSQEHDVETEVDTEAGSSDDNSDVSNDHHETETEIVVEEENQVIPPVDTETGSSDDNSDVSNDHHETETEIVVVEENQVIPPVETETEVEIHVETSTENVQHETETEVVVEANVEVEVEAAVTVEEEQQGQHSNDENNTEVNVEVEVEANTEAASGIVSQVDTADSQTTQESQLEQESELEIAGWEVEVQIHVTETVVGSNAGKL